MAVGKLQPFVAVAAPANGQRSLRLAAAASFAFALLAAVVVVQRSGSDELMQGSDEVCQASQP